MLAEIRAYIRRHHVALLALLTAGLAASLASPSGSYAAFDFSSPTTFSTGDAPWDVAMGDLDDDLDADLAVPNRDDGTVSVLEGTGAGGFGAPMAYAVGQGPTAAVVAYLDEDSALDLVTANIHSDDLSVLLGNGDRTFGESTEYESGNGPTEVAVADLNGDTMPDVVSSNFSGNGISVLMGNGDGTLDPRNFVSDNGAYGLAIGKLNGDAFLDIAAAATNSVSVLTGNGDGTFDPPAVIPMFDPEDPETGFTSFDVAIGDLDADGHQDLVTAIENAGKAAVLMGNGDGSFDAPSLYRAGGSPVKVVIAPLDRSAGLDLAIATADGGADEEVALLSGNGDGTFDPQVRLGVGVGGNANVRSVVARTPGSGTGPALVTANSGKDSISTFTSDNCPGVDNPDQADIDQDGLGDPCDILTSATVPNGGTVTTGEGSTPVDPVQASVTTPNGGLVSIQQQPPSGSPGPGFAFVGYELVVEAPDASVAEPLSLSFLTDAGLLPVPEDPDSVEVYRDGTAILACTGAPQAVPDPCVSSRAIDGDGDLTLTILSSHASVWEFAVADSDPPESAITKGPPNKLKKTKAKFTFIADENATFQCQLDNRAYAPCTSPKTMKVSQGRHTFRVLATDAALNVEAEPATRSFKVVKK